MPDVRDNTERQRFELDADGHVAFSEYRRDGDVLAFLGFPEMGGASGSASPVCYADEDYFKGR